MLNCFYTYESNTDTEDELQPLVFHNTDFQKTFWQNYSKAFKNEDRQNRKKKRGLCLDKWTTEVGEGKKKKKAIHMRRTGQFSQGSDDSSGASQSCISNRYRDNLEKSETSLLLNEGLQWHEFN